MVDIHPVPIGIGNDKVSSKPDKIGSPEYAHGITFLSVTGSFKSLQENVFGAIQAYNPVFIMGPNHIHIPLDSFTADWLHIKIHLKTFICNETAILELIGISRRRSHRKIINNIFSPAVVISHTESKSVIKKSQIDSEFRFFGSLRPNIFISFDPVTVKSRKTPGKGCDASIGLNVAFCIDISGISGFP